MNFTGKVLMLALLAAPYLAHAQLSIGGSSCSYGKPRSEGRTEDLGQKYNVRVSYPIATEDYQARYCVTEEKCIALGYCKASSPAEQAAAEKLHPEAVAERARLQRERQEREAQAERERRAAEAERNRKAAEVARETQRLGSHREAEARRLVEMREAAAKARGGNGMLQAGSSPSGPATGTPAEQVCRSEIVRGNAGFGPGLPIKTRAAAEQRLANDIKIICPGSGGYTLMGGMTCTSKRVIGVISGEPFDSWGCTADYVCAEAKMKCPSKSGRGSIQ